MTLHVLADDGNVIDTAVLAARAALRRVWAEESAGADVQEAWDAPVAVSLVAADSGALLVDPSAEECAVLGEPLTVLVAARTGEVSFDCAGGRPLSVDALMKAAEVARGVAGELEALVDGCWQSG